jgi:hypothetical protein
MSHFQASTFLRRALVLDAVASGATGALMLGGAGLLEGLLNLPPSLMRYAGLFLIPYAAFVAYEGLRTHTSRTSVVAIIAGNALWAAGSVLLLIGGPLSPTMLGTIFVAGQAFVVALFAELQYFGLRRSQTAAA